VGEPDALAAVLARNEVVEGLGEPELQDRPGRRDDEPHLLVGPELRLRQQPRQDQRQRDAERGRAAAAGISGPAC